MNFLSGLKGAFSGKRSSSSVSGSKSSTNTKSSRRSSGWFKLGSKSGSKSSSRTLGSRSTDSYNRSSKSSSGSKKPSFWSRLRGRSKSSSSTKTGSTGSKKPSFWSRLRGRSKSSSSTKTGSTGSKKPSFWSRLRGRSKSSSGTTKTGSTGSKKPSFWSRFTGKSKTESKARPQAEVARTDKQAKSGSQLAGASAKLDSFKKSPKSQPKTGSSSSSRSRSTASKPRTEVAAKPAARPQTKSQPKSAPKTEVVQSRPASGTNGKGVKAMFTHYGNPSDRWLDSSTAAGKGAAGRSLQRPGSLPRLEAGKSYDAGSVAITPALAEKLGFKMVPYSKSLTGKAIASSEYGKTAVFTAPNGTQVRATIDDTNNGNKTNPERFDLYAATDANARILQAFVNEFKDPKTGQVHGTVHVEDKSGG